MAWRCHFLTLPILVVVVALVPAFPPEEPFRKSGAVQRVDALGDPLPLGALSRLGSQRLWHHGRALAAFTPDGKNLISLGADSVFALWSAEDGKELRRFQHSGLSVNLNLMLDNHRAMFLNNMQLQLQWQMQQLQNLQAIQAMGPYGAGFSPDGRKLAVPLPKEGLAIWDTVAGLEIQRLQVPPATSPAFSPNGRLLAFGNMKPEEGQSIKVWDLVAEKEIWSLKVPKGRAVTMLRFSPDGSLLAGGDAAEIRIWHMATGKRHRLYQGHEAPIADFSFALDGKLLASVAADHTLRMWETDSEEELVCWTDPETIYSAVALAPDGASLALACHDGTVRLSLWRQSKETRRFKAHHGPISNLAFSPDGKSMVTSGMDGDIRLWDLKEGRNKLPPRHQVKFLTFQNEGKLLLTSPHGTSVVGHWPSGKCPLAKEAAKPRFAQVISPHGNYLVLTDEKEQFHVHDARQAKTLISLTDFSEHTAMAFSPDERWFALGDDKENVHVWRLADGREHCRLEETGHVHTLAFSPDGKMLAMVRLDHEIHLWELATGQRRGRFQGTQNTMQSLKFSPDGRVLAAACADESIRLWDVQSGTLLRALAGHFGAINGMEFSPDGRSIASGGDDGSLRIWKVASGQESRRLGGHRGGIVAVAFSPDGKHLASAGRDGTVLVWDWTSAEPAPILVKNRRLESLWADLGRPDAKAAFQALGELAAVPEDALSYLRGQLQPCPPVKADFISALIADLNHDRYPVREKATQDLQRLEGQAAAALNKALDGKLPPESAKRIQSILDKLDSPVTDPEKLRALRAVEVLERIGTTQAMEVLQYLEQGAPGARLTREAQEARLRLQQRLGKN